MADNKIAFHVGNKADIQDQIDAGKIDGSDFVVAKDVDEFIYVDKVHHQHVLGNAKSKESHEVNLGANGEVGGLKTGDTVDAGISIDELIKKIVTKRVPAVYAQPTLGLVATGTLAGSYEVGTQIKTTLTAAFTQNDAGALTSVKINDGTADVVEGTASPLVATDHTFTLGEGTTTFKATAAYAEGVIKNDNLGDASPAGHVTASSIESKAVTFTGKRCAFYGAGAGEAPVLDSASVRALAGKTLGPVKGTSFDIPVAVGQQYVVFAIPSALKSTPTALYVETNDSGAISKFTKSSVTVEGANGATAAGYDVYCYQMSVGAAAGMTFKITL